MNSSDSLNQDSERPETPTGRLRATKKLESIDETGKFTKKLLIALSKIFITLFSLSNNTN